jgi:hypothetical protein
MYYLGIPLDFYMRLNLQPASVSLLSLTSSGVQLSNFNT